MKSDYPKGDILASRYINGSGGSVNLFTRPKDGIVVVQWEGAPDYNSGYHAAVFPLTNDGLAAAREYFEKY